MPQFPNPTPDIAVVLIHGIGDIKTGDVLKPAIEAIERTAPEVKVYNELGRASRESSAYTEGQLDTDAVDLTWGENSIRLVEFHWASFTGKIRLTHPLRGLKYLLQVLREFPLMSVAGAPAPRLRRFAALTGRFQAVLVIALLTMSLPTMVELSVRPEAAEYVVNQINQVADEADEGANPFLMIGDFFGRGYLATGVFSILYFIAGFYYVMVVAGFLYFLAFWILFRRKLKPVGVFWLSLCASSLLTFMLVLVLTVVVAAPIGVVFALRNVGQPVGTEVLTTDFLISMALGLPIVGGVGGWLGITFANLLHDIVHYLAVDSDGTPTAAHKSIQVALNRVVDHLQYVAKCPRVVLVAHSLGTVILLDVLTSRERDAQQSESVLDIVTAGSPIRRLIRRFLPYRLPAVTSLQEEARRSGVEQWFNTYRIFDYVGQAVTYSALPLDLFLSKRRKTASQVGIAEQLLKPRYRWPLGHGNYWGDPRFLDFVAREVVLPRLAPADSTIRRP